MTNPKLSEDYLIHFTEKKDTIISILKNGFYPSYCEENWDEINIMGKGFEIEIPMVCFCDIPLNLLANHRKTYGKYGLALDKQWGKEQGITPVLYIHKKSSALDCLLNLGEIASETPPKSPLWENFNQFIQYLKPDKGLFPKKSKYASSSTTVFYDEREWRYIPKINEQEDKVFRYILNHIQPLSYDDKLIVQKRLAENLKFRLKFEAKDVQYIIVSSNDDKTEMIENIVKLDDIYTKEDLNYLINKIEILN